MPGESLNILMYGIGTYTRANIEKTANSQVHLDARSDYRRHLGSLLRTDKRPLFLPSGEI